MARYTTGTVPIPDGWEWDDLLTGRRWRTAASTDQLTLTYAFWLPPWERLAELLASEATLLTLLGWNVHAGTPDTLAAPAIVVDAADDWSAPILFNTPGWAFEVRVITHRMRALEGFRRHGVAHALIREALWGSEFRWVMAEAPENVEIAGVDYSQSVVGVAIMDPDPEIPKIPS